MTPSSHSLGKRLAALALVRGGVESGKEWTFPQAAEEVGLEFTSGNEKALHRLKSGAIKRG